MAKILGRERYQRVDGRAAICRSGASTLLSWQWCLGWWLMG